MKNNTSFSLRFCLLTFGLFFLFTLSACTTGTAQPTSGFPLVTASPKGATAPSTTTTSTSVSHAHTYTCPFFELKYSDPWTISVGRSNQLLLGAPSKNNLDVYVFQDNSQTLEARFAAYLQNQKEDKTFTNFQVEATQPVVMIGGQPWQQVTWTKTNPATGLDFKGSYAITMYHEKQYSLEYSAIASDFDQSQTQYVQSILQSFTFKDSK